VTNDTLEPAELADRGAGTSAAILGLPFLTPARFKRLVKFGLVGVTGVAVNLAVFEVLFRLGHLQFSLANAIGIVVSIFTNFLLNDMWTWGDRIKGTRRDWVGRLTKYYVSASAAAGVQLLVASGALTFVFGDLPVVLPAAFGMAERTIDVGPTLAVLTGIAFGMAINFVASHLWAFRDAEVRE
jgi:dolichol-phosphate mannosyltransferase